MSDQKYLSHNVTNILMINQCEVHKIYIFLLVSKKSSISCIGIPKNTRKASDILLIIILSAHGFCFFHAGRIKIITDANLYKKTVEKIRIKEKLGRNLYAKNIYCYNCIHIFPITKNCYEYILFLNYILLTNTLALDIQQFLLVYGYAYNWKVWRRLTIV